MMDYTVQTWLTWQTNPLIQTNRSGIVEREARKRPGQTGPQNWDTSFFFAISLVRAEQYGLRQTQGLLMPSSAHSSFLRLHPVPVSNGDRAAEIVTSELQCSYVLMAFPTLCPVWCVATVFTVGSVIYETYFKWDFIPWCSYDHHRQSFLKPNN